MDLAFFLVALTVVVLAGTAVSERIGLPPPLLLIVVGVVGSNVPMMPVIHLEADVVLFGLLPPLLYAAAVQTSLVDFHANRRPILLLSVGLVAFTAAGVAVVVHLLLPDLGWPLAFAIGAVVAPPDAVAATSIGRRIGLPRRVVTILEGESLLNDATALVALRTAIAAAGLAGAHQGGVSTAYVVGDFARAAIGGLLVGFVVFVVVAWLRRKVTDPLLDTGISFVVPFGAYLTAERFHASGVVAVVIAGLLLGHRAPIIQTAQSRITERTNWRSIAFILENTVFLLIGLQARWIIDGVSASEVPGGRIAALCAATLVAVVVLRLLWVFPVRYLLLRPRIDPETGMRPPAAYTFIVGWAGMRGVVTLAAAFVIPEEAPHREILLLIAFTVVAGTLLLQGLTLPWFARRLHVPSPDPAADALARATLLQQASKAGFVRLDEFEHDDPHGVHDLIRQRIDQRNFAAWERLGTVADEEAPSELYARVRISMIEAERERVLEIRSGGTVASDVVADVLAMLDIEESMLDVATQERGHVRAATGANRRRGEECADLEQYPAVPTQDEPVCDGCRREGMRWVALRQCLVCGALGCCDSSPGQHATGHFHETGHAVMESAEPGEDWRWCFVHHQTA